MEFIEKVAGYLVSNGIVLVMQGNALQASPDNAIAVRDTGGFKPSVETSTRYPTIQITVRSLLYNDAKQVSFQIFELLHGKQFYMLDADTQVVCSYATQEPTPLNNDSNDRTLMVCNYNFTMRR